MPRVGRPACAAGRPCGAIGRESKRVAQLSPGRAPRRRVEQLEDEAIRLGNAPQSGADLVRITRVKRPNPHFRRAPFGVTRVRLRQVPSGRQDGHLDTPRTERLRTRFKVEGLMP